MADYTSNYNLEKQALNDYINIEGLNENFDVIDEEIKKVSDTAEQAMQKANNPTIVNGHTVEDDVPANAKFTDTVYAHPATHPWSMITGTPSSYPANGGNADTVDGKHASDFAPNGYGLGTTAAQGITDCNSMTGTGWYMGSGLLNAPDANWYMIEAIQHNASWIHQRAFGFTQGYHTKYERICMGGNWQPWNGCAIEYGTTDLTPGVSSLITGNLYVVYE